jgi:hypothetical protein
MNKSVEFKKITNKFLHMNASMNEINEKNAAGTSK